MLRMVVGSLKMGKEVRVRDEAIDDTKTVAAARPLQCRH